MMKKVDDWMESNLPWGINNGIKWLCGIPFMPVMLLFGLIHELIQPFQRDFYDGSATIMWPWEWTWPWKWNDDEDMT